MVVAEVPSAAASLGSDAVCVLVSSVHRRRCSAGHCRCAVSSSLCHISGEILFMLPMLFVSVVFLRYAIIDNWWPSVL